MADVYRLRTADLSYDEIAEALDIHWPCSLRPMPANSRGPPPSITAEIPRDRLAVRAR